MADMSLSDALALRNDGNGFGGGNSTWLILFVLLLSGGFGFGGGWNNGFNGAYAQGLDNNFLFSNLNASIDQTRQSVINTQNGIASSTYALKDAIGNNRFEMAQGFGSIGGQIAGLRSDMQAGFCCVNTTMHNETQRVIDLINQNTQQSLRDQLADEKLAKSQLMQNAYLVEKLTPTT